MKDWQFATADVTANNRMKVTVMKMFSNTLVTWKSYIVHIIQSYGQFHVICQCKHPSQQSNVLLYRFHPYSHSTDIWPFNSPDMDGVRERKACKMLKIWQHMESLWFRRRLQYDSVSLITGFFFCLNSSVKLVTKKQFITHTVAPLLFSLWLISPNDFGSSANAVGDVFRKISIFSRWWWPSQKKGREASEILLPRDMLLPQQCWPSSTATVSNNCSHTNSNAVGRLAQGVDIKLNCHLKVIA